jgi:predicted glycosyltransferase
LVVPRSGPSAEQRMRAGLFANKGLLEMLDPTDLTPEVMAQRLLVAMQSENGHVHDREIQMDGAGQAATCLLELLQ